MGWSLQQVCRSLSWFAICGGLSIAFFGCAGTAVSPYPIASAVMAIVGMIAFGTGLICLTMLACFGPNSTRTNRDRSEEAPAEATTSGGNDNE